jgi:hypothetical protein
VEVAALEFIRITIADMQFTARVERSLSPVTCREFCAILPFRARLIQARWSGEAAWIPLADFDLRVPRESVTGNPGVGEILFHPADHSECEILLPYGTSVFRCKDGALAGNRFLTIVEGKQQLTKVGELVLWHGRQDITFSQLR